MNKIEPVLWHLVELVKWIASYFERLITSPAFVALVLAWMFRTQIKELLPELGRRIKKAGPMEFDSPASDAALALPLRAQQIEDPNQKQEFLSTKAAEIREAAKSGVDTNVFDNKRILWVDDHFQWIQEDKAWFETRGAKVVYVSTTNRAIEVLTRDDFDVIISDILRIEDGRENRSAGYDLLEKVKRMWPAIPVILYISNVRYIDERGKDAYGIADSPTVLRGLVYWAFTETH